MQRQDVFVCYIDLYALIYDNCNTISTLSTTVFKMSLSFTMDVLFVALLCLCNIHLAHSQELELFFNHGDVKVGDTVIITCIVYRVSEKKLCNEKVPSFDVNRNQLGIKHISMSQMKSWLSNTVYLSQFGCCTPEILLFFQREVKVPIMPRFPE